jgi:hypothetical protein
MKKILGILFLATFLILGYSCNSAEKKAAREEAEKLEKEIKLNDSIALQMETIKSEIDSTAEEVNKLIEEL